MEAWWLFLPQSWFGHHPDTGWALLKAVYFGLSAQVKWDWSAVSNSPESFADWLMTAQPELKKGGKLGQEHKQVSFDRHRALKAGAAFSDFVSWHRRNLSLLTDCEATFLELYTRMQDIHVDTGVIYKCLTWAGLMGLIHSQPDRP